MVVVLIVALLLTGAGLAVGGVFLLLGTAWALIAGGLVLIAFAALLRAGLQPVEASA